MEVTYHTYGSGQSNVQIPKSIAQAMGWTHGMKIRIEIQVIDGKKGLFLTKVGEYVIKKDE
ncbi:MAG: hypothetical protein RBG13Loki_1457 [Promethearchaeota archaeon CR_4]|nr:MAG: hypothetical protein RBG13Loki_1457 [Candidatus Lokiarchaeota archaeon CR_4]